MGRPPHEPPRRPPFHRAGRPFPPAPHGPYGRHGPYGPHDPYGPYGPQEQSPQQYPGPYPPSAQVPAHIPVPPPPAPLFPVWSPFRPVQADNPQGVLWALIPFLTFGFGTPFSFAYASIKRRSHGLGVAALAYAAASAGAVTLGMADSLLLDGLAMLLMLTIWIAGTAHAFAVRPSVYPRKTSGGSANEQAIEMVRQRRRLRADARRLAAADPALAGELRIGRPDLPRGYDDGGLIDVNHVPLPTLLLLPGMTGDLAARIVRVRQERGSFFSVEELGIDADLPPGLVQNIAEYTIFLS